MDSGNLVILKTDSDAELTEVVGDGKMTWNDKKSFALILENYPDALEGERILREKIEKESWVVDTKRPEKEYDGCIEAFRNTMAISYPAAMRHQIHAEFVTQFKDDIEYVTRLRNDSESSDPKLALKASSELRMFKKDLYEMYKDVGLLNLLENQMMKEARQAYEVFSLALISIYRELVARENPDADFVGRKFDEIFEEMKTYEFFNLPL